jgi:hypothetical protein
VLDLATHLELGIEILPLTIPHSLGLLHPDAIRRCVSPHSMPRPWGAEVCLLQLIAFRNITKGLREPARFVPSGLVMRVAGGGTRIAVAGPPLNFDWRRHVDRE